MHFLSPWMLAGAAAVSIPLAIHFFYRARYKPLPWAPMKFLKEAMEQTSRRLKFQEWVLLALRCLAIILLALALARPGFDTAVTAGRGEAIDAVFVLDTSYSMAARDGEKTRLERAKDAALAVLDTLPASSSIRIYGCADRAVLLGPENPFNIDQARKLVGEVELTSLSTDLLPGLSEALAAARRGTVPAKEIYVFSDMQKTGFERQQGAIKAKCDEIRGEANLVFIRCGDPQRRVPNIAVTDVNWISEIPHTGTSVPFVVTLKNTGSVPVKGIKVKLEIRGKSTKADEAQVDQIDAGNTHTVTLNGPLDEPGLLEVRVAIEDGGLPGDNVLSKTILVRNRINVLLVDGTPSPENPVASGSHFVQTALNPQRLQKHYIETDTVSATEASPLHLENKDLVYLLNAPVRDANPLAGMSAVFLARLHEFVQNGGGLIIACGDQVTADAYNKTLGSVGRGYGLLPFDLREVRFTTETAPFFPAADSVEAASFLGEFRRGGLADALQKVSIFRMFDVAPEGAGRVLVKTTDGRPYITSKVVGGGEVVFVASSLDERWSNFSSSPGEFQVPFALRALNHLTGRKVYGETAVAGNPLAWHPPEGPAAVGLRLGTSLRDAPADNPGVLVWSVAPGGPADQGGIQPNDVITQIDGKAIKNLDDYVAVMATQRRGNAIKAVARRQGQNQDANIRVQAPFELVKPPRPGEKVRPREPLDMIEARDGELRTVSATDTVLAGIYNIVPVGKGDDSGPMYAINPDLRESENMAVAEDSDVKGWLGFEPPIIRAGSETDSAVSQLRTRNEWTEYVLVILLLLLITEAAWAWLCGRAW